MRGRQAYSQLVSSKGPMHPKEGSSYAKPDQPPNSDTEDHDGCRLRAGRAEQARPPYITPKGQATFEGAAHAPHTLRPSSVPGTPCSRTWPKVLKRSGVVTCSATCTSGLMDATAHTCPGAL